MALEGGGHRQLNVKAPLSKCRAVLIKSPVPPFEKGGNGGDLSKKMKNQRVLFGNHIRIKTFFDAIFINRRLT